MNYGGELRIFTKPLTNIFKNGREGFRGNGTMGSYCPMSCVSRPLDGWMLDVRGTWSMNRRFPFPLKNRFLKDIFEPGSVKRREYFFTHSILHLL